MPQNDNRAVQLLKTISMFDPNKDFNNTKAKDDLAMAFEQLINMNDPVSNEFFKRFKANIDNLIKDMKIVSTTASDKPQDEVDMSPTPKEGETDQMGQDQGNLEQKPTSGGKGAIPNDLLDSYDPLVDMANNYLYF